MEAQSKKNSLSINGYAQGISTLNINDVGLASHPNDDITSFFKEADVFKNFFQKIPQTGLQELLNRIIEPISKKSFLVFKHNKYITIPTEQIAFCYVKYESCMIACFDRQEYFVNYSLEQIQKLVTDRMFFRLNRQYLVNFSAIKEVEHYFARKLLVNLSVPSPEKLLVPKEKGTSFLHWLENR